jgi:hypothetical protein
MVDPNSVPSSPSNQSSAVKWIALGCGGCFVLSTLLLIALVLLMGRTLRFAVGERVQNADQALFTYTLPGESQGIFDMGFLGLQVTQVSSINSPPTVLLTMGKLPGYLQTRSDQQTAVESFRDGLTVEGTYELTASQTEERTLCGQPVSVLVQSGHYQDGPNRYPVTSLLTLVDYNRTTRFAWILAHGETAPVQADQVFDSLQCQ